MRLVSYGPAGGERAAIEGDGSIFDLESALAAARAGRVCSDLAALMEEADWRQQLESAYAARARASCLPVGSVRIGPPIPVPRKLLIAGANTRSHLAEAEAILKDIRPPQDPMILAKATSSLCGPFDDIVHPPETRKLDYEVELCIVIGRRARRVPESAVRDYVAGFTVLNDVSARDVQLAEKEGNPFYRTHFIGKSYDTFSPCGPALVTVDEFEWGKPLKMRTEVNGEVRQADDTADLYFGVEALVSYISHAVTLFPGDLISAGSPAGVGLFMTPPRFLQPGDRVRCGIEKIGAIENTVRAEPV